MNIIINNEYITFENLSDFDLGQTLECGQCFHFEKIDEDEYAFVAYDNLYVGKQEEDKLIVQTFRPGDVSQLVNYLDLNRDYAKIKKELLKRDNKLKAAIHEKGEVRILNQEFSETLMSFIISQNKQIPHIKKIVADISKKYGAYLGSANGSDFYSFPDIKTLSKIEINDYKELKTGFRAPYLYDASVKLNSYVDELNIVNKERVEIDNIIKRDIFGQLNVNEAREKLKEIKGVGDKVANCVNLFSLSYRNAFPIDVWIKRIMEDIYFKNEVSKEEIQEYAEKLYGELGGYAQQYLFFYGRDKGLGK